MVQSDTGPNLVRVQVLANVVAGQAEVSFTGLAQIV
jgi:hypothetical protein